VRPLAEIDELVTEIERLALEGQVERLLATVRELVPSYLPPHQSGGPAMVELGVPRPVAEELGVAVPFATQRKAV
jgi:hypothetical protein